jgi:hypothetical protein
MTVLNLPNAVPSIALVIYRYLRLAGDWVEIGDLEAILSPQTLSTGPATDDDSDDEDDDTAPDASRDRPRSRVAQTVSLLAEVGLLEESSDKAVRLLPSWSEQAPVDDRSYLSRVLRELFLAAPLNMPDLWGSDRGTRDFTRALTWFLMQNVWRPAGVYSTTSERLPGAQQEQYKQLPTREGRDGKPRAPLFNTGVRWNAFARWAIFLGFVKRDVINGKAGIAPDPTVVVKDTISQLSVTSTIDLPDLITSLSDKLPVIDRGRYRAEIEARLLTAGNDPQDDLLSSSLSHALLRLQDSGFLQLDPQGSADAPRKVRFEVPPETPPLVFARIKILGEQ